LLLFQLIFDFWFSVAVAAPLPMLHPLLAVTIINICCWLCHSVTSTTAIATCCCCCNCQLPVDSYGAAGASHCYVAYASAASALHSLPFMLTAWPSCQAMPLAVTTLITGWLVLLFNSFPLWLPCSHWCCFSHCYHHLAICCLLLAACCCSFSHANAISACCVFKAAFAAVWLLLPSLFAIVVTVNAYSPLFAISILPHSPTPLLLLLLPPIDFWHFWGVFLLFLVVEFAAAWYSM